MNVNAEEPVSTKTGKSLLNDKLFQRLRQTQQEIALQTDTMPTMRKLLDLIITNDAILQAKETLIEMYSK